MTPITLKKYYLLGLPPLFLGMVILKLLPLNLLDGVFFWLGYSWPLLLLAPGMEEKAKSQSYAYSFVRMIYYFHSEFERILNKKRSYLLSVLIRSFGPLLFVLILFFLLKQGRPLFALLGTLVFESVLFFRELYLKKI